MTVAAERPKIAKEPITVLLPAYNQAAGLEAIAGAWLRELDRLERPYELFVIDDASTDGTGAAADRLAANRPSVRVFRHEKRQGFGACLRTGLAAARHPLLFYTACDYPYPPSDLRKLLDAIDEVDIASGARTDPMPGWLRAVGRVYRLLVRIVMGVPLDPRPGWRGWAGWWRDLWLRYVFGLRLTDVSCAFKLFRRSVFDRLPIQSDGEFAHAEILAKANFMERLMTPVPVGRLAGNFKGLPEPPPPGASYAAEAMRVFRRPTFLPPARPTAESPENAAVTRNSGGLETARPPSTTGESGQR